MSFDNFLFAVTLAGIILSLAYYRAAYRQWRAEKAWDSRRLNAGGELPRNAAPVTAGRACTVLDFKGACARKARHASSVDAAAKTDAGMQDPRQRSGGTV